MVSTSVFPSGDTSVSINPASKSSLMALYNVDKASLPELLEIISSIDCGRGSFSNMYKSSSRGRVADKPCRRSLTFCSDVVSMPLCWYLDWFGNEHRDCSTSLSLIIRIRWECFYSYFPESASFNRISDLTNAHILNEINVSDLHVGIGP